MNDTFPINSPCNEDNRHKYFDKLTANDIRKANAVFVSVSSKHDCEYFQITKREALFRLESININYIGENLRLDMETGYLYIN